MTDLSSEAWSRHIDIAMKCVNNLHMQEFFKTLPPLTYISVDDDSTVGIQFTRLYNAINALDDNSMAQYFLNTCQLLQAKYQHRTTVSVV